MNSRLCKWLTPIAAVAIVLGCSGSSRSDDALGFRPDFNDKYPSHAVTKTEPEARTIAATEIKEASFVFSQGSGMYGYDCLKLLDNGDATFLFSRNANLTRTWHRVRFKVPPDAVAELKRQLLAERFFSLPAMYSTNVADGGQWRLTVTCAAGKKSVYCDNHFPAEMRRLSDFVREKILTKQLLDGPSEAVAVADYWATYDKLTE